MHAKITLELVCIFPTISFCNGSILKLNLSSISLDRNFARSVAKEHVHLRGKELCLCDT